MSSEAVVALKAIHGDLAQVLGVVTEDQWVLDSACGGWRVQDVLAHVTSNFKELVDPTPPPAEPPPPMGAEAAMEMLVAPRKDWTAAQVMAEYEQYADGALAALGALQEEPLASTMSPLADLGTYPMHMVANAYAFDHYCHLHHDLLAPSGPLSIDVPEADDARVRPGIDWMIAGLPQMCADALTMFDRPLTLRLTGAGGGSWTFHPAADGDFITAEENGDDGVAIATSSAHDFVSWGTKRSDWRTATELSGDTEYATAVLDAIDII